MSAAIRACVGAAFITGGFVPVHMRNSSSGNSYVHVADWFATFCFLAGVPAEDDVLLAGAVRPLDSVNIWPMLTRARPGDAGVRPDNARFIVTTEASIIDTQTGFKLVTLAGSVATISLAVLSPLGCFRLSNNSPLQP